MTEDVRSETGAEFVAPAERRGFRTFRRVFSGKELQASFAKLLTDSENRAAFVQKIVEASLPRLGEALRQFPSEVQEICEDTSLDEQKFLNKFQDLLIDFLDRNFDAREYEVKVGLVEARAHGFIPLNEIIYFGADDNLAHIHLGSARTFGPKEIISLFNDDLEKLAKELEKPEFKKVKKVTATSWIVAQKPEFFKAAGFTIDGPIGEEMTRRHFSTETRPVVASHIDREDFLRRYLK
ncbi:MAG: hypothetical protein V1716_04570 [Candidatus Uhrbacteria bacterium]